MNPMRWCKRRVDAGDGTELAAESEAFLFGRFAEFVETQGNRVPVWAWTNLLAHGLPGDLRKASAGGWAGSPGSRKWRAARGYLALEVLEAAERQGSLDEVQETVLIPLELSLAGRSEVEHWSCSRWVQAVRTALGQQRHARS